MATIIFSLSHHIRKIFGYCILQKSSPRTIYSLALPDIVSLIIKFSIILDAPLIMLVSALSVLSLSLYLCLGLSVCLSVFLNLLYLFRSLHSRPPSLSLSLFSPSLSVLPFLLVSNFSIPLALVRKGHKLLPISPAAQLPVVREL